MTKKKEQTPPPEGLFVVMRHGAIYGNDQCHGIYAGDWDRAILTRKVLKPFKPETLQIYRLVPVDNCGIPIVEEVNGDE